MTTPRVAPALPRLAAIRRLEKPPALRPRGWWTPSLGIGGRHQSVRLDVINRYRWRRKGATSSGGSSIARDPQRYISYRRLSLQVASFFFACCSNQPPNNSPNVVSSGLLGSSPSATRDLMRFASAHAVARDLVSERVPCSCQRCCRALPLIAHEPRLSAIGVHSVPPRLHQQVSQSQSATRAQQDTQSNIAGGMPSRKWVRQNIKRTRV
jgi:hypothetical protein